MEPESKSESPPGDDPRRYDRIAPRPPEGEIDLREIFEAAEQPRTIELDIGFGRGNSVFSRVETAPDAFVLGVEIKAKWATKVDQRRARLGLDRVCIWAADVRPLLPRVGPEAIVERVFVHFPDPWWKKRHQKRRVLTSPLLDNLARLMPAGGELFVQTDVPDRHTLYVDTITEHEAFELRDAALKTNPFGAISNRERRAEEDGLPVHRLLAIRS